MKLPRLLIAVIVLPVNLAIACPVDPLDQPATPATPNSAIMQLQFESCVWLNDEQDPDTVPLTPRAVPRQEKKVCTQVRLIPPGHAMPELSKLRPIVGDALPSVRPDDAAAAPSTI